MMSLLDRKITANTVRHKKFRHCMTARVLLRIQSQQLIKQERWLRRVRTENTENGKNCGIEIKITACFLRAMKITH